MIYSVQTWLPRFGIWSWVVVRDPTSLAEALMRQQLYEYRIGVPARVVSLEQAEREYEEYIAHRHHAARVQELSLREKYISPFIS